MSKPVQCELCLGYSAAHTFWELCPACQNKAASYDIIEMERDRLKKAVEYAIENLGGMDFHGFPDNAGACKARGALKAALLLATDTKKVKQANVNESDRED